MCGQCFAEMENRRLSTPESILKELCNIAEGESDGETTDDGSDTVYSGSEEALTSAAESSSEDSEEDERSSHPGNFFYCLYYSFVGF